MITAHHPMGHWRVELAASQHNALASPEEHELADEVVPEACIPRGAVLHVVGVRGWQGGGAAAGFRLQHHKKTASRMKQRGASSLLSTSHAPLIPKSTRPYMHAQTPSKFMSILAPYLGACGDGAVTGQAISMACLWPEVDGVGASTSPTPLGATTNEGEEVERAGVAPVGVEVCRRRNRRVRMPPRTPTTRNTNMGA